MSDRIRITKAPGTWVVRGGGAILGETENALRLEQPGREPVIYIPRDDIAMAFLEPSDTTSETPKVGRATYYSLQTKSVLVPDVGWSYEEPTPEAAEIAGHLAFEADKIAVEEV